MSENKKKKVVVPIWQKLNLTIEEAMAFSDIGRDKLYELTSKEDCPFVLWVASRRLIRRKEFEEFIMNANSL